jgi:hypothetical protein
MAATLTDRRFTGHEWTFERKLDGIRMLAFKQGSSVRLLSRNQLAARRLVSCGGPCDWQIWRFAMSFSTVRPPAPGAGRAMRTTTFRHPVDRRPRRDRAPLDERRTARVDPLSIAGRARRVA